MAIPLFLAYYHHSGIAFLGGVEQYSEYYYWCEGVDFVHYAICCVSA
jgi:hypothetical protein